MIIVATICYDKVQDSDHKEGFVTQFWNRLCFRNSGLSGHNKGFLSTIVEWLNYSLEIQHSSHLKERFVPDSSMVYISQRDQVLHPTEWVVLLTGFPSSSFNLWFATFMSDLCHCSLLHNPKQIENHFPCHVSIHEVAPIQVPICTWRYL